MRPDGSQRHIHSLSEVTQGESGQASSSARSSTPPSIHKPRGERCGQPGGGEAGVARRREPQGEELAPARHLAAPHREAGIAGRLGAPSSCSAHGRARGRHRGRARLALPLCRHVARQRVGASSHTFCGQLSDDHDVVASRFGSRRSRFIFQRRKGRSASRFWSTNSCAFGARMRSRPRHAFGRMSSSNMMGRACCSAS